MYIFKLICGCLILLAQQGILAQSESVFMKGITVVAPPYEFFDGPMLELAELGADWVAVIPYGYTRVGQTQVYYNADQQWWGEKMDGARKTILLAQKQGLQVFLKPHVYVPTAWPGAIEFDSEDRWLAWEKQYTTFIMDYARLAAELNVDMFSIGTEFVKSTELRHDFWHDLITLIQGVYSGKLTYSSNWDEYSHVPFWEELDFIGVDAYFPLVDTATPSVDDIVKAWEPHQKKLKRISEIYDKQILFTEYGYLSIDNCAHETWVLEKNVRSAAINEQAQANAIEGLFKAFKDMDYWAGGFYWKWFPNMMGHEGYPERDYTFQGKKGEEAIRKCFAQLQE